MNKTNLPRANGNFLILCNEQGTGKSLIDRLLQQTLSLPTVAMYDAGLVEPITKDGMEQIRKLKPEMDKIIAEMKEYDDGR